MAADLDRFRHLLDVTADKGHTFEARCPAHTDNHASLSVSVGDDGGTVLHCHAGCPAEAVMAALGLGMGELMGAPRHVANYAYLSPDGAVLWMVERWANPKTFRVNPGLPAVAARVLYNLPDVIRAVKAGTTIYVVEGEKDVETLRAHGLVGTCNVGGAGKWLAHYGQWLIGATVVVIADNDEPGLAHARKVAMALVGLVESVAIERPLFGKDVTELLTAGFGIGHTEPVTRAKSASIRASDLRQREIDWAWNGYIPFGAITVIDGDPGDGKSTFTCKLVAMWSHSLPMPGEPLGLGSRRKGSIMITAEDDAAATILPRLKAAGANLENVTLMADDLGDDAMFLLTPERLAALADDLARDPDIGYIIIDPLSAFWSSGVNSYVDADVRAALRPLARLARAYNVAIILVRHLTKSATRALYAGGGSIGIVGAARAAFLIKADPRDPTTRLFLPLKNNLGPKPVGWTFHLEPNDSGVAAVHFDEPTRANADDFMGGTAETQADHATAKDAAGAWLWQALDNTWLTWRELVALAKNAGGWSEATLRRAKDAGAYRVVKNPSIGGIITLGHYWIREDQNPFETTDGSQVERLLTDTDMPRGEQADKLATVSDIRPPAPEPEPTDDEPPGFDALTRAQPRVCDVCGTTSDGATVVGFAGPWWVVRCMAHDPRNYRP